MLRKILLAALLLLIASVGLAAGLLAYAQTARGQDQLAGLLGKLLSRPDQRIELIGLRGSLPFDVRLAAVRLADRQGVWLEAENARLTVEPSELLRLTLTVRALGAERVALHRIPTSPTPAPAQPFSLPEVPDLPGSLPVVSIDRIFVDRLDLAPALLGTPAAFGLDGSLGTGADGRAADLQVALRRLDAPTARADVSATLDLRAETLTLAVTGSETGGLIGSVTGRPDAGGLYLDLEGAGPLADWRGRLELSAERLAAAAFDLELAYATRKRLQIAGGVDLKPGLLPDELARAVGPRLDLAFAGHAPEPTRLQIDRLELRSAMASLSGTGNADLANDRFSARLDLDMPDLAPMAGVIGTRLGGGAHAALTADGRLDRPRLKLTVAGADLAAATGKADSLDVTVDAQFLGPFSAGAPAVILTSSAALEGLAVDGRELGPGGDLELDLEAEVPASGQLHLRRLDLQSPLATLRGRGVLDRNTLAGTGRLDLTVPDLVPVITAAAPDLQQGEFGGGLALGVEFTTTARAEQIDLTLVGDGQRLRLPEQLAPLVGPSPTLRGRLVVTPAQGVAAQALTLAGAGFRLQGDPSLVLATQALSGAMDLAVPDLAVLVPLAGQPLSGALDGRVALAGTLPQPNLQLDFAAREVAVAGQRLERAGLAAIASGPLAAPEGAMRLEVSSAGAAASIATRYALADRKLALSGIVVEAPATRLSGDMEIALDGPLAVGGVAGRVRDLAALDPLTRQGLAGSVGVGLKLSAVGGRQAGDLTVDVDGVRVGTVQLRNARVIAQVRDALGAPQLSASLVASSLAGPGFAVGEVDLTAEGSPQALAVRLTTAGDQAGRAFDLRTTATIDAVSTTKTVRLASFEGSFSGQRLRLAEPTTLRLGASGAIELDRTRLAIGPGQLALSGNLAGERVQADAELQAFDLAVLETFGGPLLNGIASAQARLRGTTRSPTATVNVAVGDFAMDAATPIKPDLVLDATLEDGQLTAELGATGLGDRPLTATASLPVRLALQPFAFALAPEAPLRGRIDGVISLARVMKLVPAPGTQVAGDLVVALGLGGTVEQPILGGSIDLAGGTVQNLATGIELRDLVLRINGRGRELVLTQLGAVGPAGGTLNGTGRIALLPGGGVQYDGSVKAGKLRALNNELGRVILSGAIDARGDLAGARAGGTITLDSADIAIPDGAGPSVPVLEVREVNSGQGSTAAAPVPRSAPFDLALDVRVEAPARLFVRGRGLDSEWGGTLTVQGPAAAPEIVGELEFRRGFLDLLDKRFEIRRGIISFVGSQPPVPMIDLEAVARSEEIQALVRLQGPATDPKLELSSEPVLPQDEILSRLLFGSSVARLTPVQGLRLAAAVDTLRGGGGLSDMLGALRKGLGVDTLDVGGGATPQESTAKAGKYVSDNVFVEVERGVSDGTGKARVQVDLTPNLSVKTEVDEESQTGVGLQWRYDY